MGIEEIFELPPRDSVYQVLRYAATGETTTVVDGGGRRRRS